MSHAFQLLFTDCNYPRAFVWWIGMHAVLFFYLFSDFYNNTYKSNNKQKFSKQKSVMQSFAKFVPCNLQMDKLYSNGHTKSNGHTGNGLVGNGHTASSYYINGDLPQELRHRTSEAAAVVAAGN
ncbi:hypothetical protein B566_EDAN007934 [Ephemera danica]|nr:hypothetical protein B566_EDAN007934 [Ephemera danica]